jgi:AraC-like DNA-binding protein
MRDAEIAFQIASMDPLCIGQQDKVYLYAAVHFMERGSALVRTRCGGPERTLTGAWCWCARPGAYLAFRSPRPRRHWRLAAIGRILDDWADEGLLPAEPRPVDDVGRAVAQWRTITAHAFLPTARDRRIAANALEAFLLDLAAAEPMAVGPAWAVALRERLDRSPALTPDYRRCAREAGVTPAALRRDFAALTGQTPHRYLLHRRCAEARRLLADGRSLAQVAEACGYRDVFFFSRQFRRLTGVAPGEFRRRTQG